MKLFTVGTGATLATLLLMGNPAGTIGSAQRGDASPGENTAGQGAMYILMEGKTVAHPAVACNWYAYPVNGTYPFTYQWSAYGMVEDGVFGQMWRGNTIANTHGTLQVLVTDANGQTAWGTIGVYGSRAAEMCTD